MHALARRTGMLAGAAALATAAGCTSLLGDVTFDRADDGAGGGTSSTSSSGGGGAAATCEDATCDVHATCSEASGEPVCTCQDGYHDVAGDGTQCTDWDECAGDNGGNHCVSPATCVNTGGGYACDCPAGDFEFPAGGGVCVDDPCLPPPCNDHGTCDNTSGVADCSCVNGWAGDACDVCARFVDATATGEDSGLTWADAFTTIQPAIDSARDAVVAGGVSACDVWVKEGTYYVYASGPEDTIALRTGTGLYGGFGGGEKRRSEASLAAHPTILSGHKSASNASAVYHVLVADEATGVVVDGFTIQGGQANGEERDASGGGLMIHTFQSPASVTVSGCEITANSAESAGGGIGMVLQGSEGTLVVRDGDIHHNTSGVWGGGVFCAGTCNVTGTTFRANTSNEGGGLRASGLLIADGDSFYDNVSSGDGGGMGLWNPSLGATLANLFFSGNRSTFNGGGFFAASNDGSLDVLTIASSVFVGNVTTNGGGAADFTTGGVSYVNCTITGNRATGQGDGIWSSEAAPALYNTVVWGNPSLVTDDGDEVHVPNGTSATTSHCDLRGYAGDDVTTFDADPAFVSVPLFFDRVLVALADPDKVQVTSGSAYASDDVLEVGGDGVGRSVTGISGNTVSFQPALSAAAGQGTSIRDWGEALGALDLQLSASSMCIDAGDSAEAPSSDIAGNPRFGLPDIGAYERHP